MPRNIHTTLFGNTLDCSKLVRIDNCVCQLYVIKHDDASFIQSIATEIDKPAFYILLNEEDKTAYIGQTDSFKDRLSAWLKQSFWKEALCFQANDNSIHVTSVRYLEALGYELANSIGNYTLSVNSQVPRKPNIQAQERFSVEEFFGYIQLLTKFIGCDIFTGKQTKAQTSDHQIFFCTRSGCDAKGYFVDDTHRHIVVLAGSKFRKGFRSSMKPEFMKRRIELIDKYCSIVNGVPVLKQDYTFTSPSLASAMLVGGNSNGWNTWHDENGKTIDELFRK